ncbi:MAG: hypothetical protein HYY46_17100 [Deltaproteobacteria bacterium]|nr:hypothetical protein [Deltaproteobacteria bacterium]
MRDVVREAVYKYLGCGDLKKGFARMKCQGEMRIVSFIDQPDVIKKSFLSACGHAQAGNT